jgi:hypothetical protein
MTTVQLAKAAGRFGADRYFFVAFALALSAFVWVGFAPTFYTRSPALAPLTALRIWHGAAFTLWMAFFITQTSLVASGRTDIHRRLGIVGACLAAVLVGLGLYTVFDEFQSHILPPFLPPATFLVLPIMSVATFGGLVLAAVLYRGRPEVHKRLMLLATIAAILPAMARILMRQGPFQLWILPFNDLLLIPLFVYDLATRRRLHPVTLWVGLAFLARPIALGLGQVPFWIGFADWLGR